MNSHIIEWLNLLGRWVHIVAGIAWIGSSFFFMWLDSSLEKPSSQKPGVEGELWMVHSGGFYQVEKRLIRPGEMPKTLHWFKWEATFTWISGFFLLNIVYYFGGGIYLVDPAVSPIGVHTAIAIGLGTLPIAWLIYDLLFQSPIGKSKVANLLAFGLLVATTFGLSHVFSARAAYIHVGAILGTLMVTNVWVRILPAQQAMIDATAAGRQPNYELGRSAKRRSIHNNYMTFPVLFIMLSNHFPSTYGNNWNWAILVGLVLAGAGVKHVMNLRAVKNTGADWMLAPVAALVLSLFLFTSPKKPITDTSSLVQFSAARAVIMDRCLACHSANPTDDVFKVAPAGILFDTPERIQALAERIKTRAVVTKTMPLANKTGMTEEERALLGHWIDQGAKIGP